MKTATKCTNGDGVLFGSAPHDVNRTEYFDTLDTNYIENPSIQAIDKQPPVTLLDQ